MEIAPKSLRATMLGICQLFVSFGVSVGFFFCYGTIRVQSSLSWRLPFILATFSSLLLAFGTLLLPFSPRWLLSKNRTDEAKAVLDKVDDSQDAAEREEVLAAAKAELNSPKAGFLDIFSKPVRRRTLLGTALNMFQQLTGVVRRPLFTLLE